MSIQVTEAVVGLPLVFAGYAQENESPVFQAGDRLTLIELSADVENNGFKVQSLDDPSKVEMLFNDEVSLFEEDTTDQTEPTPAEPAARTRNTKAAKTDAPKVAKPKNKAEPKTDKLAAPTAAAAKAAAKGKGAKLATPEAQAPAEEKKIVVKSTTALASALTEGDDAMESAVKLSQQIEESYFTLGGVLLTIHVDGLHKTKYPDKGGFEAFVEGELGIGARKARQLMDVYQVTTEAGFDEARLSAIGWTKAREVVREVRNTSPKEFEQLVAYAEKHTRDELLKKIEKDKQKRGAKEQGSVRNKNEVVGEAPETVQVKTFTFKLKGASATIADEALAAAMKANGTEDLNKAFEAILSEWGSLTHGGTKDQTLEDYLTRGQELFGQELGIVEYETEGEGAEDGEVAEEGAEAAE